MQVEGENNNDADLYRWAIEALELTITVDNFGLIRHVGRGYAEILELQQSEIIGKPIQEIIPNTRMLDVLHSGEPDFESVFIMKNNQPIVVNRYPIRDDDGKIRGAICITGLTNLSRFKALNNKISNLLKENTSYKRQLDELQNRISSGNVIGHSDKITRVKELAQKVADSDVTVLLSGETGTGKEVFANYIKQLSFRRLESYVKINCAAIPKELLESELFGYCEGSFSGAKKGGKKGKFELADNGTILLDEIGGLPFDLQAKLLRVLQEKEIDSIGCLEPKKVNVRVICNTNQNLEELVQANLFREDLFYRINVVEIEIPPLRERLDDIPLLCSYFIKKINNKNGMFIEGISNKVIELFYQYKWPGNVRELENVLERACIMSSSVILEEKDLEFFEPRLYKNGKYLQPVTSYSSISDSPLNEKKRDLEKRELVAALLKTGGNKSKAAKMLRMPRSVLYDRIKMYKITLDQD